MEMEKGILVRIVMMGLMITLVATLNVQEFDQDLNVGEDQLILLIYVLVVKVLQVLRV